MFQLSIAFFIETEIPMVLKYLWGNKYAVEFNNKVYEVSAVLHFVNGIKKLMCTIDGFKCHSHLVIQHNSVHVFTSVSHLSVVIILGVDSKHRSFAMM